MRVFRFRRLAVVLPVALAVACGGGTGPQVPGSIVIVSGGGQQGIRSAPLAAPVVVRVLGTDGRPFAGAVVTFFALANANFIGTDTTDAAGEARVSWTLHSLAGDQRLRVDVAGVTSLLVDAVALDPCFVDTPYAMGQAAGGELTRTDCLMLGAYADFFAFPFAGGSGLFTQTALFDTFVMLVDAQNNILAVNDDDPAGGRNSVLRAFMQPGNYRVAPTSFNALTIGSYQIGSQQAGPDLAGCQDAWIVRGTTVSQTITNADCTASGFFSDQYLLILMPAQNITITMRSAAVDAFLAVLNGNTGLVQTDNDNGGGTDASITLFGSSAITLFVIDAGSLDPGEVGAYTLSVLAPGAGPVARHSPPAADQGHELRAQRSRIRRAMPALLARRR